MSSTPSIPLTIPSHINLAQSQLRSHPPYKTWLSSLHRSLSLQHSDPSHPFHKDPYSLHSIEVQSVDFFGGGTRVGFIKLKADVRNEQGERLPGIVLLRGGSVAMLLIVRPEAKGEKGSKSTDTKESGAEDEEYVILTVQPRVAAGSLSFVELPAGMIDDSGSFEGAAAKEIQEETGLEIREDELIDLTKLALRDEGEQRDGSEERVESHLQQAVYPSAGGCDEFIPIFLARKTMSREEIKGLKGKLTGLRDHGEKITLRLCRLQDLWKVGARDAKTLAAVALYEGLKRESKI